MKQNFGKKNWIFPMPVLMIGTFDTCSHTYHVVGDKVADAFSCGKALK